jgi:hypothetical protein
VFVAIWTVFFETDAVGSVPAVLFSNIVSVFAYCTCKGNLWSNVLFLCHEGEFYHNQGADARAVCHLFKDSRNIMCVTLTALLGEPKVLGTIKVPQETPVAARTPLIKAVSPAAVMKMFMQLLFG